MRRHPSHRRARVTSRAKEGTGNPKYEPAYRQARSGRMPLTLIDGSSTATIARDLAILAASFHASRPCYAQQLQRAAQQIADGLNAAGAVAAYTTTPSPNVTATERTFTDPTFAELIFSDTSGGPL